MTITVQHATQATGTDAGTGEIRKTQWNESHTFTVATGKLLGRTTASAGAVEEITPDAATLDFTGGTLSVKASTFQPLDAELTALAGLTSAADRVPYFTGSGTAAVATLTSFARTLLDDTDAATMRATLGVVESGTAQPLDAELTAIAGLTSAADRLPYFTGSGTADVTVFTAAARALLDDANAAAMLTTLGAAASGAVGSSGLTMATARLLGRTTASTGAPEEITVGAGLTLSAGSLTATAATQAWSVVGTETVVAAPVDYVEWTTALDAYRHVRVTITDLTPATDAVALLISVNDGSYTGVCAVVVTNSMGNQSTDGGLSLIATIFNYGIAEKKAGLAFGAAGDTAGAYRTAPNNGGGFSYGSTSTQAAATGLKVAFTSGQIASGKILVEGFA